MNRLERLINMLHENRISYIRSANKGGTTVYVEHKVYDFNKVGKLVYIGDSRDQGSWK